MLTPASAGYERVKMWVMTRELSLGWSAVAPQSQALLSIARIRGMRIAPPSMKRVSA